MQPTPPAHRPFLAWEKRLYDIADRCLSVVEGGSLSSSNAPTAAAVQLSSSSQPPLPPTHELGTLRRVSPTWLATRQLVSRSSCVRATVVAAITAVSVCRATAAFHRRQDASRRRRQTRPHQRRSAIACRDCTRRHRRRQFSRRRRRLQAMTMSCRRTKAQRRSRVAARRQRRHRAARCREKALAHAKRSSSARRLCIKPAHCAPRLFRRTKMQVALVFVCNVLRRPKTIRRNFCFVFYF